MSHHTTQRHYDQHAGVEGAAQHWRESRTKDLRRFHNNVKRRMINRLSFNTEQHVDIACGRGGDIRKWCDAQIHHVVGVDLSPAQVVEAQERAQLIAEEYRSRGQEVATRCEFFHTPNLGVRPLAWPRQFDTASCMFSAHYLFHTRETARNFFRNVSLALKDGGRFYGIFTSAQAVLSLLNKKSEYRSELLRVRQQWEHDYASFGSPYTFAILHTVTNDNLMADELGEGTPEYLTFFGVFTKVAAEFGLYPDTAFDWECPATQRWDRQRDIFDRDPPYRKHEGFRYLRPRYDERRNPRDAADMATITRLYAAYVFVKDTRRLQSERAREEVVQIPHDAARLYQPGEAEEQAAARAVAAEQGQQEQQVEEQVDDDGDGGDQGGDQGAVEKKPKQEGHREEAVGPRKHPDQHPDQQLQAQEQQQGQEQAAQSRAKRRYDESQ
ncbi:hypothetical protein PTSG_01269 [Salpingoeca rosetta]|uniref:mRNA (guanine-N(7))-methyltransferase n=1 Tax=Salpingoeca rosetta (strain ATCC 50818 / BSB-021) TaxID=946362 RepID=F2TZV1_SALR5|nr:uncharacterized protein PTSG_01269 [Salpingoeca rosetta]EGD80679.1 hypothetical protein PTSG_01269 [Salpingoeca rosetta]|eukprot:XP_004997240.1 hypothetical protein PTSG_01269 [Salpingoeca rosetta]